MIQITDKSQCCGCNACINACPKSCITKMLDEEGFAYPLVDTDACIDCHLCEKACPIINPGEPVVPLVSEAITFNDEKKRIASSSGGAFTAIAEEVIARGGVVFGAKWTEDWHVVHDYTETIEGLAAFRGSKYVQCDTSDSYTKVRDFLKSERWVLYSGTPCQIRGLKLFLRKDYDKLITVDFICHGVPSIKVLHAYVKDEIQNYVRKDVGRNLVLQSDNLSITEGDVLTPKGWYLKDIRFRDKSNGWKKYSFAVTLAKASADGEDSVLQAPIFPKSAYMAGFGANLYLRPSCHQCPARNFSSGSDFTLADYWGVNEYDPKIDDDKGLSLVAVKSEKGQKLIDSLCTIKRFPVDFKQAYRLQTALFHRFPVTPKRAEFWASDWQHNFCEIVNEISQRLTTRKKIENALRAILRALGIKKIYKFIRK